MSISVPIETPVREVRLVKVVDAPADRAYRCWSDPQELVRWFPDSIEGSLAVGSRSVLVWPDRRIWWEVLEAEPARRFVFRWPWASDESIQTQVSIVFARQGMGTRVALADGPFELTRPGGFEAYVEALSGWGAALAMFRAYVDFAVDVRRRSR